MATTSLDLGYINYEKQEVVILAAVESPTLIPLEGSPVEEGTNLSVQYGYLEYELEVKEGDDWAQAPLVSLDGDQGDVRNLNKWLNIIPDSSGGYVVEQPTDMGFISEGSPFRDSFDLTKHSVIEEGNTYRLTKSYRITIGGEENDDTYQFEFQY